MEPTQKPENLPADDFFKFDLRVGTILTIEAIPKSKKLLKLEVDFGPLGKRLILAGLAPRLEAGTSGPGTYLVEGQKVVAVLNLAPRTMMGIESHGMLLAAHDESNKIWLVNPGPVPDGVEVG
jgi:methionine--tRNA ligase beta chain